MTLPCDRCGWMPKDCTCRTVEDPVEQLRLRHRVAARHRTAVDDARLTDRLTRRGAA